MPTQLAERRRGGSDGSRGVNVEANSSEVALFSLLFNSINFCLPGVDVTIDAEKAEDPNTGVADVDKPGTRTADSEEVDGAEADGAEADGVEADGVKTDRAEVDRAEAKGVEADKAKVDGADKPGIGIGIADPAKVDRVDKPGIRTGIADQAGADEADEPGIGIGDRADELDTGLGAKDPRKRPAEK